MDTKPMSSAGSANAVGPGIWQLLRADRLALTAAVILVLALVAMVFAPAFLGDIATTQNLRGRNSPPFTLDRGWWFVLGGDALGRPLLARVLVASQNTMSIALVAVTCSLVIGTFLGLVAGYGPRWLGLVILRLADVIMSFPSLLLALIVLYILPTSVFNLVFVLSFARIPVYLRTARAEVLEVRSRMFVQAAQVMGASSWRIIFRHIFPVIAPTLLTIATLDFAYVMLAESSLSFLGIGVQPPEITWGLMVSQGRPYLANAWWLSVWPGLAIVIVALSLNLLSNWMRIAFDPAQRWRLERSRANG